MTPLLSPVTPPGPAHVDGPRPRRPWGPAWLMYRLHRLLAPNAAYRRLAAALEAVPWLYRAFTAAEEKVKRELFGCRMCGQCALPVTGYACPMTCPKQLRNGPCGGVGADGSCEVYPGTRCVWLIAAERAAETGHTADLDVLQLPVDNRRRGESSWINYWQDRDDALWLAPPSASGSSFGPAPAPGTVPRAGTRDAEPGGRDDDPVSGPTSADRPAAAAGGRALVAEGRA